MRLDVLKKLTIDNWFSERTPDEILYIWDKYADKDKSIQLMQTAVIESVCNRINNPNNNRCLNCGAKAGYKCELQTVL
jgi:hypothetical protein